VSVENRYYVIYPIPRDDVKKRVKFALKGWIPNKAIDLVVDEVLQHAFFHEGIIIGWGGNDEKRAVKIFGEIVREMRKEGHPDWRETRLIKVIKVAKLASKVKG